MALVSKTGFIKLLGRSPSFLLGGACLGSTASIPRIRDTFNSGCLNLKEQIQKSDTDIQQTNDEEDASSDTNKEREEWLNSDEKGSISVTLGDKNEKNVCYHYLSEDLKKWISKLAEEQE